MAYEITWLLRQLFGELVAYILVTITVFNVTALHFYPLPGE